MEVIGNKIGEPRGKEEGGQNCERVGCNVKTRKNGMLQNSKKQLCKALIGAPCSPDKEWGSHLNHKGEKKG